MRVNEVRWDRWEKVLRVIERQPEGKVRMTTWLLHKDILNADLLDGSGGDVKSSILREDCRTAGCLGGWTVLALTRWMSPNSMDIPDRAKELLNLSDDDSDFVFHGMWATRYITDDISKLRKPHVVAYMAKALTLKTIRVHVTKADVKRTEKQLRERGLLESACNV